MSNEDDSHELPVMCSKKTCREVCTKGFIQMGVCKSCIFREIPDWAIGDPVQRQRIFREIKQKYKDSKKAGKL